MKYLPGHCSFIHVVLLCLIYLPLSGQKLQISDTDSVKTNTQQKDIFDVLSIIFKKEITIDTLELKNAPKENITKSTEVTLLPYINYSLVTRWAFGGLTSGYFYLDKKPNSNMSTVDLLTVYTLRQQLIIRAKSTIFPKGNKLNLVGDWRFMKYPSLTFGLGPNSSFQKRALIDYNYVRIYQYVYKNLSGALFAGIGYKLDYHYNISENSTDFISDFDNYYEGNQKVTMASGPTLNLLYDSRRNLINPVGGSYYGFVSYRYNTRLTGSDSEWQSVTVDARKYIKLPGKSTNVLALWSYNWFTFGGNPAYLDLPSTGWDANDNQGRGYIQGRFRSNNLVSFETEYRFSLSRNKLFGGVVFGNVQSVSNLKTTTFEKVYPAFGAGMRIKIHKQNNSNLSVDFAFGMKGARTVMINLGEVF